MRRLGSLLRTRRRESSRQSLVTLHGVPEEDNGGAECERCPGASDSGASLPGHSAGGRAKWGIPRDASIRSGVPLPSPLLLLLRFPLVETAQKVLEDAIALFFLELSLEKDRGVRWINSVKVLLFSLSFLFYFCTVHRGVLESRIRWVLARTRRNVETLVGSTC